MQNVVVKESHLVFGGMSYFRVNAEEMQIGSIGEKRKSILTPNYLEVEDYLAIPGKNLVKATTVEIDTRRTSKKAFNVDISTVSTGDPKKLKGDAVFSKLKEGKLKLVKFSVDNNIIRDVANKSKKLKDLIYWGSRARIVHQVFIIMEARLANKFNNKLNLNLTCNVNGINANLGVGSSSSGKTSVKISKGTCFAYLMLKIKWDARAKSKRTRIVDLDNDQWGIS